MASDEINEVLISKPDEIQWNSMMIILTQAPNVYGSELFIIKG